MTTNLLRMAVRIKSAAQLKEIQTERSNAGNEKKVFTFTRNVPKRVDELLEGGSIYWVIKRLIRVRQEIIGIDSAVNTDGRKYCRIELNPEHIFLEPRKHKPFQGWRYLKPEEAPIDLSKGAQTAQNNAMPDEMVAELKELGLF